MTAKTHFRLLSFVLLLSGPAAAADAPPAQGAAKPNADAPVVAKSDEGWIVTLQAIGAFAPSYPGSARLRAYPFPGISVRKIGEPERFSTPDDSFGFAVVDLNGFRAGPVANFVFYRGSIPGLHEIPLTHEVGGFAEFAPLDHFRARSEVRQGIDGHKGFVAALSADIYGRADAITVSVGPRLSFGNNRYANAYYSVSPFEAVANGHLEPYEATGGFTSAGGMATLRYDFAPDLNATFYSGLQRLTGSVGGSPIPNQIGSSYQFTTGLAISRSFEIKRFW
jgi:MipA family protein